MKRDTSDTSATFLTPSTDEIYREKPKIPFTRAFEYVSNVSNVSRMFRGLGHFHVFNAIFGFKMSADAYSDDVKSVSLEVVRSETPRKRGRPIVLTLRVFIKICHLVEQGASIPRACEACSVSYGWFGIRVSRSQRLQERLKRAEKTRFNLRHEQAIESIMEAGTRSWMAHAWWAERNLPERYAMRAVPRPADTDSDKLVEDLPAEKLAHFRALQLELAREDEAKAAAKALPESPASDSEAVG